MNSIDREKELKKKIASAMGTHFVDALYQGTTENTSTSGFVSGLSSIADYVTRNGSISANAAKITMEQYNPGNEYRSAAFIGHLGDTSY